MGQGSAGRFTSRRVVTAVVGLAVGSLGIVACARSSSGPTSTATPGLGISTDDHCPKGRAAATPSAALHAAIVRVEKAAGVTDETGEGALPGYAGVLQCPDTNELFVFWKGHLPGKVAKAVAAVDLKVTVNEDAPHSAAELAAMTARLWADRPYWEAQGIHVQSSGARPDGLWLEVGVNNNQSEMVSIEGRMSMRYPKTTIRVAYAAPLVPL